MHGTACLSRSAVSHGHNWAAVDFADIVVLQLHRLRRQWTSLVTDEDAWLCGMQGWRHAWPAGSHLPAHSLRSPLPPHPPAASSPSAGHQQQQTASGPWWHGTCSSGTAAQPAYWHTPSDRSSSWLSAALLPVVSTHHCIRRTPLCETDMLAASCGPGCGAYLLAAATGCVVMPCSSDSTASSSCRLLLPLALQKCLRQALKHATSSCSSCKKQHTLRHST